ncbi:hypothetical protein CRUP_035028, partial [Coryphaenoides rupestris]
KPEQRALDLETTNQRCAIIITITVIITTTIIIIIISTSSTTTSLLDASTTPPPLPGVHSGLNGSILRSVSMVLLLTVYLCCGGKSRSRCNYREIAGSYRDIILVEIQRLNLTSSLNTSEEKHHCPSGRVHHILRSIYTLTRQFRCHQGVAPEKDLERPVESMEQLLAYYCRQGLLVKGSIYTV